MFPPSVSRFSAILPHLFPRVAAPLLLAGFFACQQTESTSVVLAEVDDAELTLEDLRDIFPEEYEQVLPREQYLDVIQRWIDDEAVYQEALKRRLHEDPQMQRKLERLRRRMIVEEFLAREAAADALSEPDESTMMRYYENNKSDFRRKTPEYRYMYIRSETLREALDIRERVRGNNFAALAAEHAQDSGIDPSHLPFRKPSEIPTCLHEMLDKKAGWLSNPLSCPDGVYLVRLQERIEAGAPLPFAEVRAAISAQLAMQHKDRMRASKVNQYKEGVAIRLNVDQIPGVEGGAATRLPGDTGTSDAPGEEPPSGE